MVNYVGSVIVSKGKVMTTTISGDANNNPICVFDLNGSGKKKVAEGCSAVIKKGKIYYVKINLKTRKCKVYQCSLKGKNKKAVTGWLNRVPSKYLLAGKYWIVEPRRKRISVLCEGGCKMSLWLQEEMEKIQQDRSRSALSPKYILALVFVFAGIEAAVFLIGRMIPGYKILTFFGVIGFAGFFVMAFLYVKTKSSLSKPQLPVAAKCLQQLELSSAEFRQFVEEMKAEPLLFLQNGKRFDKSITITEHYLKAAFLYRKEIDYGIFRLSDIDATWSATSKNPVILKPKGRIFDILLLDAKGQRMGGVSMENEKDYKIFNDALEKYAPNIRLNIPAEEIRKNSQHT